ncbi:MAG: MlaD family protein [candidate division KSB1 bacterium]|nr:MlaD family protein [candidate division KSB1 bacterium]
MEYRTQEVKAGFVVLVAIIILFSFLFAVTKTGFQKEVKYYTARFTYTNGIQKGTAVRIGGMLVGEVENVYFPEDDNTKIEVLIKVRGDAPVRTNSMAYITTIGLMGEYYVELTTGTPDAPLLPSGSRLNSKDVPTFSRMGEPFQRVADRLEIFLERLNQLLDAENQTHFSNIIAHVDTILDHSQKVTPKLLSQFTRLTQELTEMSARLDELMANNSAALSEALLQFNSSMMRAESLLVELSSATARINHIVALNEVNLHEAIRNFQDASRNFEEFSRQIKYQPWSLIRKSALPERKVNE